MNLWRPKTESDLQLAISNGIDESHYLEFKREFANGDSARKETARDLASFARDGGVIVVGIDEPEHGRFELAPILLEDASERIELIAANRVEPGLFIRTSLIATEADPNLGYLVVEVPPSSLAPHMVDGQYWGRSERTKRRLSDAEVVQMHAGRIAIEDRITAAIAAEIHRDPAPRPSARMFLVAEPLQAPSGLARQWVRGAASQMIELSGTGEGDLADSVRQVASSPHSLSYFYRRSQGLARTRLSEARTVRDQNESEHAEEIEVQISGAIRILSSGFSYPFAASRPDGEPTFIRLAHPIAWAHRLIAYAARLGPTLEYYGPWGLGVHLYGLSGTRASVETYRAFQLPVYESDIFEAVTTAQLSAPNAVTDRLIGDLIHAYGTPEQFADALS